MSQETTSSTAPAETAPAPPRRSWRRKLAFSLLPTVLFFVACELGVRIREKWLYGSFSRAGQDLYKKKKDGPPGLAKNLHVDGAKMKVDTNSLGFRGPEIALSKPAKTVRIVCIGASTTFDIFAKSNDATWPARLQKKLREKHPEVEVVNAAVAGYTIESYLENADNWDGVAALSPDVIVGYFATNEISHEAQGLYKLATPEPTLLQRAAETITGWSLFAYKVWLFDETYLRKPVEHEGQHELPESCALDFEKKLHELARRTKALNAKLALGTFALRWRADQPPEVKRQGAAGSFNVYVGLSIDGIDKAFRSYNEAIARVAKSEGGVLIPAAEELSGDSRLFGDSVHFSEDGAGSERMATIVARELEAAGVVEPKPR
jgi:lysophospholipase L1-like esterase